MKASEQMEIRDLFEEDPLERDKFKSQVPTQEKERTVFEYFDPAQNKVKNNKSLNPFLTPGQGGFDLRQYRIRQA
eukprot:CAMPEP_0202968734 /NCGR_PEP_ID=MMETSP1396-20130829/14155_1 /ASSEMBLY_ACC=CAM_ASM_000872 /TAXON_ID= /ORGANISM="Pseudokeronopsis sp., Strain Brazil" /LENGTH=74 /DNA_ID=CAMNT_0049695393 /DNA_START=292 /DNA_END=516 /DNA_ORIENTATION=+